MSQPKSSFRIIVADDHPIVLSGLVSLLNEERSFKVIQSGTDSEAAIHAIRTLKPDIALLDMKMPKYNGLEILKVINSENIPTRVVFLAASLSDDEIVFAVNSGVYGIILKESAPDSLIECLHACARGEKWWSTSLVQGAMDRVKDERDGLVKIAGLLTPREIEIMLRVSEGLTNRNVGRSLNITEGTVKLHLHSIYQKLGVGNRTSLANFAAAYSDKLISFKDRKE